MMGSPDGGVGKAVPGNPIRHIADDLHPDVVGFLSARMDRRLFLAMRLKWAGDGSGWDELERHLYIEAGKIAVRRKWRTARADVGQERIRKLCRLALTEMASPGAFVNGSAWQRRAAVVGVGKSQWFSVWSPRYEAVYAVLNGWVNSAWEWMKFARVQSAVKFGLTNPD